MESVPPKLYGGTERVVAYLSNALVAQGHEVTLFASGDSITTARLEPVWPKALRLDSSILDYLAPYALMLAIPGLNVVSIADLAGEMGPIELYRDAGAITGRAGLVPSRYQSDQGDRAIIHWRLLRWCRGTGFMDYRRLEAQDAAPSSGPGEARAG